MMICGKKFWLKGMLDMKSIRCPKCGMELELPREYKGQNVLCPGCGFKFTPSKCLRFALCAVRCVQGHLTEILLVILIILAGYNTWQIGRNNLKNYNRFVVLRNNLVDVEFEIDKIKENGALVEKLEEKLETIEGELEEIKGDKALVFGGGLYSRSQTTSLSVLHKKLEAIENEILDMENTVKTLK